LVAGIAGGIGGTVEGIVAGAADIEEIAAEDSGGKIVGLDRVIAESNDQRHQKSLQVIEHQPSELVGQADRIVVVAQADRVVPFDLVARLDQVVPFDLVGQLDRAAPVVDLLAQQFVVEVVVELDRRSRSSPSALGL